ncbi:hypothetical protein BT96DRAFT_918812 [Gymnopus androsaceus JB14]|uniref:F-box domain-containing protein n=1 Tax=Gymnopus androsaceus JB14 TaxID=1447944 RepID=A0A6A4HW71_9AGAR|nr:hypothetical protein BT96DRAFT_918812 [Gymnopus androsaceus JB14]
MEPILTNLKNARNDLQHRSDSARYLLFAPIGKVPSDVLNEIFPFCLENGDYRDPGDNVYSLSLGSYGILCSTLKLSWVCSFWRTFIQSRPNLWSSFKL